MIVFCREWLEDDGRGLLCWLCHVPVAYLPNVGVTIWAIYIRYEHIAVHACYEGPLRDDENILRSACTFMTGWVIASIVMVVIGCCGILKLICWIPDSGL